jgi:hypothetical protein
MKLSEAKGLEQVGLVPVYLLTNLWTTEPSDYMESFKQLKQPVTTSTTLDDSPTV